MPKAEKGTPKDIANRMKAKGLQKLKFYCQMCAKQCRDENGFKCHLTSDSHLRQMKIFCSNSSGILDSFSAEFEKSYLETLYRRHRTKKMNANNVYQELIQDKHHVHMNATKWTTLSDFVQYLGKTGKCVVEETERGWYVTYIERDPTILAQQENYQRRVDAERRQEERLAKQMELQRMEAAKLMDRAGIGLYVKPSMLLQNNENGDGSGDGGGGDAMTEEEKTRIGGAVPIELKLPTTATMKKKRKAPHGIVLFEEEDEDEDEDEDEQDKDKDEKEKEESQDQQQKLHVQQQKLEVQQQEKESRLINQNTSHHPEKRQKQEQVQDIRTKNWLTKDILVRIISKKFANGKFYKRKGIINRVYGDDDDEDDDGKYMAQVEILDSGPDQRDGGDILDVDQKYLETVVPKDGKRVRIVNGRGRGRLAILLSADHEKCRGTLELVDDGSILKKVDFDDFSKAVSA